MASEYRIHRPYVLAALPRPLDHTDGRIVAREVYGQKGRKRTELAVGIDGETASVYNVPASRLITSYPIPPQDSFTCPPYSVRARHSTSNDILRCTFISTKNGSSRKMTLFKDVVHPDGKTTSTTSTQTLPASPVRYIAGSPTPAQSSPIGDVVAVCESGELVYLSGESLSVQWSASSKSAVQDVVAGAIDHFEVEYVSSTSLAELRDGMFKNRLEVFSALPKGLEPTLFVMVTKSMSQERMTRHLVVLAAMPGNSSNSAGLQKLIPLDVTPIGTSGGGDEQTTYQVDIQSGLLLELFPGSASIYDLGGAVPKQKSAIQVEGAESFLRLSRPFLLSTSLDSLSLFNYQHRSIHAKAALDLSELPLESQSPRTCQLLTYLRSQDLVVALVDNVLVSIQIEPPKAHGKRRRAGLLIDSIGRGSSMEMCPKKLRSEAPSMEFSSYVPGTMTETYLAKHNEEVQAADELLGNNELAKWEDVLRQKFNMGFRQEAEQKSGATGDEAVADLQESAEWEWMTESSYPPVDRRWTMYAISQVFSVETSLDEPRPKLRLVLADSNVTTYLVVAGHLTLSNLMMAFRADLSNEPAECRSLASSLIDCIIEADASMTLLLNYLQATKLGEVELLLAIRILMLSMDLISGTKDKTLDTTRLLTNEPHDGNDKYEMDLDDLEREIAVTEHYLGDESSSRSRGLTLAFTKLWRLPAVSTVRALRATIQTEEILAFIYLLRIELVRGAWTSLYIDPTRFESEGNEPPPDGVITLIADLLGRCLDAIGAGGWLFNDAMSWADKTEAGDFLTALKLEVTAALEGIEEAVYLNGVVGEAVRFGITAGKRWASRQTWNSSKPISVHLEARESRMLPLGLKTKQLPTMDKVVSGGEVVQRSMRETGHLISRNVEAYSLEKIAV
ncbi:utp8 family protein [Hirsutella rhossiliensis]|uniref:Utp8 family domain-containing protein n=1 Tax=Hirsutella rhossiliensis TaxID=111463 RepID=A0A9P8MW91_9HYPO|nr:utp8 family domain-containing protein [Hirsutella rhossiliensis]KAH0961391.1 utp8 family domain-containing protein [Hirsutella rhossiliensis]